MTPRSEVNARDLKGKAKNGSLAIIHGPVRPNKLNVDFPPDQ
jgi:hypothetical protein